MKEAWNQFVHWSGWSVCARGWKAFVRWQGWRSFARWKLWRPHPVLVLLLCLVSAGALVFVFGNHLENSLIAYPVYCVSAYSLTVLILRTPAVLRWWKESVLTHPLVKPLAESEEKRFLLDLFREQIVNFGYGLFKTIGGLLLGTVTVWTDGLYNLVQGIIQLGQLALHRKHMNIKDQWKSYRICGWMILVLHLTMTGLVFLMIHRGQVEEYPGYMIFATAAFTFYKLIHSFVSVARDRKHRQPVDSSVNMLDLTQAMFSMFSLQVAMIHAFDDGTMNAKLMNSITGCAVCLLVVATGIYMIRRGTRELKKM